MADDSHHIHAAEEAVLGAILLAGEAVASSLSPRLAPHHFLRPHLGQVYGLLVAMAEQGIPIDVVSVEAETIAQGVEVGGDDLLAWASTTPTTAHAARYAQVIVDAARRRGAAAAGAELIQGSREGDLAAAVGATETRLTELMAETRHRPVLTDSETQMEVLMRQVREIESGARLWLPTGLADLDEVLLGFRPGQMVVLGASTGVGKTSLAVQVAHHIAAAEQRPVMFASLEMRPVELWARALAQRARVSGKAMMSATLDGDGWARVFAAQTEAAAAPMVWVDDPGLSPAGLAGHARRVRAQRGDLCLVVVDYLQLLRAREGASNRVEAVTEMSRALKLLAMEEEVAVLALSQLSRAPKTRPDQRPQLSDLRESGAIEQDADVVLLLHQVEDEPGVTHLNVAKNRMGETARLRLTWMAEQTRFAAHTPVTEM